MTRTTRKSISRKPTTTARKKPAPRRVLVMVATRKGAWLFHGDAARKKWRVDGPRSWWTVKRQAMTADTHDNGGKSWQRLDDGFPKSQVLGHIFNHLVLDPRDGRTLLAAAKTGHLGPTIFRSTDRGRTWKEAKQPPAFAKAPEGENGRAVDHTFWLTPCHANEPNAWYAGTSPQGLFSPGMAAIRGNRSPWLTMTRSTG